MERLKKIVKLRNVGEPMKAHLVKRDDYRAIYERDDDYFEVFKIKKVKAEIVFGQEMPDREVYPHNEDFGVIAWCTQFLSKAEMIYDKITPNLPSGR